MNLQAFLNGFLDLINYPEDKNEFINKFTLIIYDKAIEKSLQKLPEDQKNKISEEIKSIKDFNLLNEKLNQYFPPDDFNQTLKDSAQGVTEDFLATIEPEFSDEQMNKIANYFSSFNPQA